MQTGELTCNLTTPKFKKRKETVIALDNVFNSKLQQAIYAAGN